MCESKKSSAHHWNPSMLKLSKAFVGDEELIEIKKVFLETVNFGLGIHVQNFEDDIKKFIGVDVDVVCVNTGTSALHIALAALSFPKGSEIIVPSITFVASYSAISLAGLTPISCDVNYPDCHINCEDLEKRIGPKTVAIMPVAYAGTDFDRKSIYEIAEKYKLRVIEDDAHAFGSFTQNGVRFGATGDVICFSFDGIKNITCGEGGAVVTRDKELAHQIRVRRSLGIEKDVVLRYQGGRAWEYDVSMQGFRYHMSNINAAIGIAQLRKFSQIQERKQQLLACYKRAIKDLDLTNVLVMTQEAEQSDCLHIMSCLLPENVNREYVRSELLKNGVESGFHYKPNHLHSFYKTDYCLPHSEKLGPSLISLPFHPTVPLDGVHDLLDKLKNILSSGKFLNIM